MKEKITAIGITLMIAILTSGCMQEPQQEETVKIGAILPLTGNQSYFGQYYSRGLDIAAEEINNAGGINGKKLKIVYEDCQADTKQAISAYQKLSSAEDIKIYATTFSGVTLGLAPLAERNKHILFNLNSAAPSISKAGDYVFRNNIYPPTEIETLANFIYGKGYRKIALFMFNNDAGVEYKKLFSEKFVGKGGEILVSESFENGSIDFRAQLAKIKEQNPEAIVVFAYPNELGLIFRQAKELGLNIQFFSFYNVEDPKLIEVAGNLADGLIYTHCFVESSAAQFGKELENRYGTSAGLFYSATAYDTVKILAEAIKKCKEENTGCIRDELYKVKDYPGVSGQTSINADGDTQKATILKTIKNKEFVLYEGN